MSPPRESATILPLRAPDIGPTGPIAGNPGAVRASAEAAEASQLRRQSGQAGLMAAALVVIGLAALLFG